MQKKKYQRIISGILASLFAIQLLVFGDSGNNGIVNAENIEVFTNAIQQRINSEALAEEFYDATEGLGDIDYYDVPNISPMRVASLDEELEVTEEIQYPSTLTVSGYVEKGTVPGYTASDETPITVYIFDENWSVLASYSFYDGDGYEVSAEIGNAAHVKIECDGYLPFYLKNFGTGNYVIGSGESADTITLIPGDTKYNYDNENQWSDDTLNSNDGIFVESCRGAYVGDVEFNHVLDVDADNEITEQDIVDVMADYTTYSGTDVSEYAVFDIDYDGLINGYDLAWFDYYYGSSYSEIGNATFSLWDADVDGYVSDADIEAYINSVDANENYWTYMLDLNGDYLIDSNDTAYLSSYIGLRGMSENYYPYMDKNLNGTIDDFDINWFEEAYQTYGYCESENAYKKTITLFDNGYFSTSLNLNDTNLNLNGNALYINDCMSFTTDTPSFWSNGEGACLDINGGYLLVANNLIFRTTSPDGWGCNTGQTMNMNGGAVVIGNEFDFGQANCYDKLIMTNPNDYLEINGNWNYVTSASAVDLWTDGFIGFYGPTWEVNEASGPYSVYSSNNHIIEFGYEYGKQVILWDNRKDFWYETDRMLNYGFELDEDGNEIPVNYGISLLYDYTPENYYFRPSLPFDMPEPDYTLYRKGWEIGDGVHIATGNYTKSFTDLSISSPGIQVDFIRTYNSTSKEEGSFGIGWDFNIDVSKIIRPAENWYQVVLPDGSNSTFKKDADGNFTCENNRNKMEVNPNGEGYIITIPDQTKYYYNNDRLYKITDSDGNTLTITDIQNNIRTVTDATGRMYKITYNGDSEHLRVTKIEDIVNGKAIHTVNYNYDNDYKLISATSVSGGTEYYSYDDSGYMNKITNCYEETLEEIVYYPEGKVNYLTNSSGLKQVYTYDKAKKKTGVQEFDGDNLVKTYKYDYDEKYAVTKNIVETDGKTYEVDKITYSMIDGKNKYDEIAESVDIMGNVTKYERDGNGNVIKTINPDGTYTLARYNDKNSPLIKVDENKNVKLYKYGLNGTTLLEEYQSLNPVSNADALVENTGNTFDFSQINTDEYAITSYVYYEYSEDASTKIAGLIKKITDPEGNVTEYEYYESGIANGLPSKKWIYKINEKNEEKCTQYFYNDQLQVSKEISPEGYVKEYKYDKFNNITEIQDKGRDGSTAITSKTEYDLLGRKIKEISPNYAATEEKYTSYVYNPDNSVKSETNAEGYTTSYIYDAYGNIIKKINPDGTQNITKYDGLQREISTAFKSSETGYEQVLTSTSYEFVKNYNFEIYKDLDTLADATQACSGLKTIKLTHIEEGKSVKTEIFTDFRGNTITEKTNDKVKRTNAYYANGQLRSQTDAKGYTTKYEYGFLNKLTKTYIPFNIKDGNDINYSITENYYDKNGNVIKIKQMVQEQESDSEKYSVTENEYNELGLLTKVTLSDGTINGCKNITKYFYDYDGIKTSMQTGLSSNFDTDYLLTEYTYDNWNRLVTTSDSTGYVSGRISYDLNGNIITSTDANGNTTANTYDALNRVLTSNTVNPDDSSKNVSKSYTYDNMGRLKRTVNNGEQTYYEYDILGRKIKEYGKNFTGYFYVGTSQYVDRTIVGVSGLLIYSNTSYQYDDEMRVIEVYSDYEKTASYTYDENGNKATQTLTNGTDTIEDDTVSTYTYNLSNKIISIVNTGATQSSYEYSYYLDGSDSCKIRTENGIIEKIEYEYDGLKRLVSETETIGSVVNTYTYEYDDYGNRIQMTASGTENFTTVYEYNNADGEYTALLQKEIKTIENGNSQDLLLPNTNIQQTVYTYDANGNQITKTDYEGNVETYSYDGLNQLIGFTDDNNTASYTYNANGLRASKTVNGITIEHVWDGNKQIIADVYDTYNATCYVRGTSLLATYVFSSGSKTDKKYYLQNAHGDVVNLFDADGETVRSYRYDAFGVEKSVVESDTNPFRYCGEYYDKETGTIYLRARYYNPSIGRFISRDSFAGKIEDPLSLNLYTYCHNNPIIGTDPSGHFILTAIIVGAVAGAVISGSISLYHEAKSVGGISNMTADNWGKVGVSAGVGGICGAVGGGAGAIGTTAVGAFATASAASPLVSASISNTLSYAIGTGIAGGMAGGYASTVTKQALYGYNDPYEIARNTAIGGVTGGAFGALGYKISNPYQKKNTSFYKTNSQVGRSLKSQSDPNTRTNLFSEDGTLKQSRFYGEDGKVFLDIDYVHSNGDNSHKFPHYHDWDWTKIPPRQEWKG